MYVCCIGFAQKFLTDGFIPDESIATICGGVDRPKHHIKRLVAVGLLERQKNGYQIHDYLDFNDSAVEVKQKRESDRVRKESERNPNGIRKESGRTEGLSERNPSGVLARAPASHPIPSVPIQEKITGSGTARGRGNGKERPKFQGSRFAVFQWQEDELTRTLGQNTEVFNLPKWYFTLDQRAAASNEVIPRDGVWAWLQARTLTEARARGLPIADTRPSREVKHARL